MSKRHKKYRNAKFTPPQAAKRINPIGVAIMLVMVAAVSLGLWWWKASHAQASLPILQPVEARTMDQTAATATIKPNFEKLKGKWLRPDGGYILEVRQVGADGSMDAAYLNPRPINVSRAAASSDAGQTKVFVELRDRLYPGNYYTLVYDAGSDQLEGVYHHLGLGQQFDVVFARMK